MAANVEVEPRPGGSGESDQAGSDARPAVPAGRLVFDKLVVYQVSKKKLLVSRKCRIQENLSHRRNDAVAPTWPGGFKESYRRVSEVCMTPVVSP